MTQGSRPVGLRGLTALAVTAIVGVVLAVHGWSARHSTAAFGSVASASVPPASPSTPAQAHSPAPPSGRSASSAPPGGPAASSGPTASAAPTAGPLLSAQAYAQYAFRVWPGPLSTSAKAAEAGLAISVRRQAGGLLVSAGVNGQPASPARRYPAGARVYVVEAALGDDSGNTDYNLGDDGLVVTDARGRIIQ